MTSTIKVDNVQNQPGTNIVSKCGTDVTLGASGDTVALASGATQTGFGRTGTVDWDTSIHTGTVTAATGKGYFVNTTSGGITVNLPAAAVGSIVAVSDYASTAASNNITIAPNGSEKINGVNNDYTISTAGLAVTLVYADATRGWKSVTGSDADATGVVPTYIVGTGGTITCSGDYKIHTFTSPGTFTVCSVGNPIGSDTVDYLVTAGGGGGTNQPPSPGQGGGAGGLRISPGTVSGSYTVSPLGAAPAVALPVSATGYPITVGAGGAVDNAGASSSFSTIPSAGGGSGYSPAGTGGSGGGTSAGNTPPTTPPQGQNGGPGTSSGGGGAGGVGGTFAPPKSGGVGGVGSYTNINPVSGTTGPVCGARYFSGGGGGGYPVGGPSGAAGGKGGGGAGAEGAVSGGSGTANTGGGGGGGGPGGSGTGGSGIVIMRYKFQ